jgi:hypothetical protein
MIDTLISDLIGAVALTGRTEGHPVDDARAAVEAAFRTIATDRDTKARLLITAVRERDEYARDLKASIAHNRDLAARAESAEARVSEMEAALGGAEAALVRAREALNRDRTGLALALEKIGGSGGEVAGRWWMRPLADGGGWASYSYEEQTEETLRKEIGWAFDRIGKIAMDALRTSGNLAHVEVNAITEPLGAVRRALAARLLAAPEQAPWYEADGSTVMLPADEVERRRKLAAQVIGMAHDAAAAWAYFCAPKIAPPVKREIADAMIYLRSALAALDAPRETATDRGSDRTGGKA